MTGPRPERDEAVRRLANALRSLQRQSGCTLRVLEARVRVSDSSLSRYFRGESVPVWPVVRDLCRAMGADPAEYRALWEAADRATRPGEEGEKGEKSEEGEARAPGAAGPPQARGRAWWRRSSGGLSRGGVVAVASAAAAAGGLAAWALTALLLPLGGSGAQSAQGAAGRAVGEGGEAGVVVHNAEEACRKPRTHDCALALAHDPYRPYVRSNAAGRVWHHDLLQARCTVADGVTVTDENGKHSSIWIQVTRDGRHVWLPGIRVAPDDLNQLARLLPHCPPVG
ncbi:helix-turn-helix domain-containing protein [Streptomyces abyssomicinicus]|uniref:helix-turn-helix domain-containing protein n=1 Tax=Streptomyces abyssomicinicus TaxID=574929 RepID=UPI0012500C65|nr:helix-turn-helix transcriptional regulator [Streptomyces abyssomicinicus]